MSLRFLIAVCFTFFFCMEGFSQGDVKKFCLEMTLIEQNKIHLVKIKNGRKVTAINKSNGKIVGKKVIRIDKRSFQVFKNTVVNDLNFYQLPGSINCVKCENSNTLILTIKTQMGNKTINGIGAEEVNKDIKGILNAVTKMVGFIKEE